MCERRGRERRRVRDWSGVGEASKRLERCGYEVCCFARDWRAGDMCWRWRMGDAVELGCIISVFSMAERYG